MFFLLLSFLSFLTITSAITTDSGCTCATIRSIGTTPNISASFPIGCGNWNGNSSRWCATNVSIALNPAGCGFYEATAGGFVDFCSQASISIPDVALPDRYLEWDQSFGNAYTFYSGQNMSITWTSTNINENVIIQYMSATGLRTITPYTTVWSGGWVTTQYGTPVSNNQFTWRVVDPISTGGGGSTSFAATNVPFYITAFSAGSSAWINATSTKIITIINSRLGNAEAYDSGRFIGTTNMTGGSNIVIQWRAYGSANSAGISQTTITLRRSGSGTVYTTLVVDNAVNGNGTANITVPATTNGNNGYYFQVSTVVSGYTYSASTSQFQLIAAPSPSPTPTQTPTPSRTPTPSVSATPSNSMTPSNTRSPTPSASESRTPSMTVTPTISLTPSTTETARASIDIAAIARAANSLDGSSTTGMVIGAVVGTVVVMVAGFVAHMMYQRKKLTTARLRKLKESARWAQSAHEAYGVKVDDMGPPMPVDRGAPQMLVYKSTTTTTNPGNSLTTRGGGGMQPQNSYNRGGAGGGGYAAGPSGRGANRNR